MPTLESIPDRLVIPLATAATIQFSPGLSARDIAHAVTVSWLSAQRGLDDHGGLVVDRNGLKAALGFSRSGTIAAEEDRIKRLAAGWIRNGDGEWPCPSLPISKLLDGREVIHRGGARVVNDARQRWLLDGELVEQFKVTDPEEVIELPRSLLEGARCRWSVYLMCRVLCWAAGRIHPMFVPARSTDRVVVRLPIDEALERLDQPEDADVAALMHDVLDPAAADISRCTEWGIDVKVLRTTYRNQPRKIGKATAIEFSIAVPVLGPITYPPARVPGVSWERPDGPARRRKPELLPGMVAFDPDFARDVRSELDPRGVEIADTEDVEF